MASTEQNLSSTKKTEISGVKFKFAILVSDWNHEITYAMRDACIDTLRAHGVKEKNIAHVNVPGAYELPFAASKIQYGYDAIICIGCVIKGETKHDEYISQAVANGIMHLNVTKNVPVIFGVLTTDSKQQAIDRAGGKHGNKGDEAAMTALRMASLNRNPNGDKFFEEE